VFEMDTGRYPTVGEGLNALLSDPGVRGWTGPYLASSDAFAGFDYGGPMENTPALRPTR
jgi:Type II secretion system (T2SS), protein G